MRNVKLYVFFVTFLTLGTTGVRGQDSTYVLSATSFSESGYLPLPKMTEWRFHEGNDPLWANPNYDHSTWQKLDSMDFAEIKVDQNGLFECWLTIRIKLDSGFTKIPLYLHQANNAASDIYIDGDLFHSFGNTNYVEGDFMGFRGKIDARPNIALPINQEVFIAVHFVELHGKYFRSSGRVLGGVPLLAFWKEPPYLKFREFYSQRQTKTIVDISILSLVSLLIWLIVVLNPKQIHLKYVALTVSFLLLAQLASLFEYFLTSTSSLVYILSLLNFPLGATSLVFLVLLIARVLEIRLPLSIRVYLIGAIGFASLKPFVPAISMNVLNLVPFSFLILCIYFFISRRAEIKGSKMILAIGFTLFLLGFVGTALFNAIGYYLPYYDLIVFYLLPISLLIYIAVWLKEMIQEAQEKAKKVIQITEEKKVLLENQNSELERQVNERTSELNISLEHLKSTQSQLVHSEKMASLGELTAGIAHEIQNPLNFVNNFSEVSEELASELNEELEKGDIKEAKLISDDVAQNLQKISHHGKRASDIVKSMLEHSRTGEGKKELTDINKMADEYLRLAYHGLRAKDKSFNAEFKTDFDDSIPKVNVVAQDIGRVLLNLINNAFHAVAEVDKPVVVVKTRPLEGNIEISVSDNGTGIPNHIKDKIFEPFFTTKPTGQGTGLGLSMSYDIITKGHGGELSVTSEMGSGSVFTINIPI
jgi:two-component system NtrC family sensor kinase